jgi:hypothetical protein
MSIVLVGSTSGSCTLQEQAVAGTTVLTLPTVSGTVLTDTSPKAGNVIQVVQATYSTNVTTSGTTLIDTGLTATITPTSSSNKILVIVCQNGLNIADSATGVVMRLLRGSTVITTVGCNYQGYIVGTGVNSINLPGANTCFLDSPATTSAITYKTQFARQGGSGNVQVQAFGSSGDTSTITLMEIAA